MEISRGTYVTAGASAAVGTGVGIAAYRDTLKQATQPDPFKMIFGKGSDGFGRAHLTPADFRAARQWGVGLGVGMAAVTAGVGLIIMDSMKG